MTKPTTAATAQQATQGSLLKVDVSKVVSDFVTSRGWDKEGVTQEKQLLAGQLEQLEAQQAKIAADIKDLNAVLDGIDGREEAAKEHAKTINKALGSFASEAIIRAALEERFPQIKRSAPAAGGKGKPTKEEKARRLEEIKTVLDYEGLSMTDVAKALEAKGVTYAQPTLKGYLEDLASDQNSGVISAIPAGKSRPLFMLAKTETK